MNKQKIIIQSLGEFTAENQVIDVAFKLPSYVESIEKVMVFSPERINNVASTLEVELSLWMNNWASKIGNIFFPLGHGDEDIDGDPEPSFVCNKTVESNTEVNGYVKCLDYTDDFTVKLYLFCKLK